MKRFFIILSLLFLFSTFTIPIHAEIDEPIVSLDNLFIYSSNYILVDKESGQVLASKNPEKLIHPASITKVLTTLTALEMLVEQQNDLDTYYALPDAVFDGLSTIASTAGFRRGESYTLRDILYGIMLPSGADATRAISMYLTGDPEGLSDNMNQKAQEIGMDASHFSNTSGLDEDDHLSTVYDLALLLRKALENDIFRELYETASYTARSEEGREVLMENYVLNYTQSQNFNELYGAKSGYTEKAERALSSVAKSGDTELIFISTNAPNETTQYTAIIDAINVYKTVFTNYQKVTITNENLDLDPILINDAAQNFPVSLIADFSTYIPQNIDPENLQFTLQPTQENFTAPIEANTLLGHLTIRYDDTVIYEQDIINPEPIVLIWYLQVWQFILNILKIAAVISVIGITVIVVIREINRYRVRKRREERKHYQ